MHSIFQRNYEHLSYSSLELKNEYFKRSALHWFDKITQLQDTTYKVSNTQAYAFPEESGMNLASHSQ